jgi:hypothetical protein
MGLIYSKTIIYLLLPAADLRMDPAPRPRPVSSLTSVTLYSSTTRLNDGIFTVHRFSVATSARLHQSECVFSILRIRRNISRPTGIFICTWNSLFLFFVFFLFCLHVNNGASSPEGAQLTVRGGGFLLSRVLFLVIMLVVYVFVVYISLRDGGH